ncbi:hypothetical protein Peur_031907 [Populus x canadensis]
MDPNNSFAFRKLLSIYNCIFLFTYLATLTASQDPRLKSCEPKNCGGAGPNISYPFWLSQEQESFCGYPNFMLNCSDKGPVLAISNDVYIIKNIFYANNSLLVANAAVYEETCPTPLHNINLDRTPFTISPGYTNISFFYNCTSKPKDYNYLYNLSCATNSTHYSFAGFHSEEKEKHSNYSLKSCHDFVIAPIHTGEDISSLLGENYGEVLKMGFLMNWTAPNCSTCESSGGRCGYENNEFICFSGDRPRLKSSDAGSSLNVGREIIIIIIGVLCGSAGILFICVVLYSRRKASSTTTPIFLKKKHNQDLEVFIRNHGPLALKRYNLSDVKKMTNFFKDKLGQGGYGIVYKGKLQDGHLVAVQVMQASKGDGEEFINEVASISRTSHVNIVTLLGFCLEGDKRVLIYEFMVNGSLEKFINHENALQANQQLGWNKLYQILVGVARGLEYLH